MAEQRDNTSRTAAREAERQVFDRDYGEQGVSAHTAMVLPGAQGDTAINVTGSIVTAQRVAIARDETKIRQKLTALAAMAGSAWVYGWDVKDRKNNRTVRIEGATIKLANDLARTWGNCIVDIRAVDMGTSWMMYGRFVDLETGFSLTRPYQQRKSMNTGMEDGQRAADMIFQVGASKCIRNVVVNALQTYADFCVDEAKANILGKIDKDPEKYRAAILRGLAKVDVELVRVERIYGRKAENWTVPDMAKIMAEVQSVIDGMALAADVWPTGEDAEQNKAAGAGTQGKDTSKTPTPTPAPTPTPTESAGSQASASPDQNSAKGSSGAPAGAAQEQQQQDQGEGRELVIEGGEVLGRSLQDVKLGDEIQFDGKAWRVIEFNDKTIVVKPAAAGKPDNPKPDGKKGGAPKKSTGRVNIFDND